MDSGKKRAELRLCADALTRPSFDLLAINMLFHDILQLLSTLMSRQVDFACGTRSYVIDLRLNLFRLHVLITVYACVAHFKMSTVHHTDSKEAAIENIKKEETRRQEERTFIDFDRDQSVSEINRPDYQVEEKK